jgi:hypothetical protein
MNALLNYASSHKSIILDKDEDQSLDEWQDLGKPHVWRRVETVRDYVVYSDTAYGGLALLKGDVLIGNGRYHIIADKITVLDRNYYGTNKYIWM